MVCLVVATDVRATVCRRKPGPRVADLQAAQGQDSSDTGGVRSPVSRVPRPLSKANTHLPQVVSSTSQVQGPSGLTTG